MNETIKEYYLSVDKKKDAFKMNIFQSLYRLIEASSVNVLIYCIIVIIETVQFLCVISLFNNPENQFEEVIKTNSKYIHFTKTINSTYISFVGYTFLVSIHLFLELTYQLLFFFCWKMDENSWFYSCVSKVLSLRIFLSLHCLIFFELNLSLSVFDCTANSAFIVNFPTEACMGNLHLALMVMNGILLFFKFFNLCLYSLLFNDFSFFSCRLPWSCPYNLVTITFNLMKIYTIIMVTFFGMTSFVVKFIVLYAFIGFLIYSRYNCPFYFKNNVTIIRICSEGCVIWFGVLLGLHYVLNFQSNYNYILIIIGSVFFGYIYYRQIKYFTDKYFISTDISSITNEYKYYIYNLRIYYYIYKSFEDSAASSILFSVLNNHIESCRRDNCKCSYFKEIFEKQEIILDGDVTVQNNDILPDVFKKVDKEKSNMKRFDTFDEVHFRIWAQWLKDIIDESKFVGIVRIEFSNLIFFYIKNYMNALYQISLISPTDIGFTYEFILYMSKTTMTKYSKSFLDDKNSSQEINKVMDYNMNLENFLMKIRETVGYGKLFWSEMKKKIFKPKLLEKYGYAISVNSSVIDRLSHTIERLNPNDVRLYKIYGTYLQKIWRIEEDSKNFIMKAYQQIIFYNSINESKKVNYIENMDTGVIIISGNYGSIGQMIYCNYSITNLLKYTAKEMIGKNIKMIMPHMLAMYHDCFLSEFYSKSKIKVLNQVNRMAIGISKEKHFIPLKLLVKLLPCIETGIYFIGFLSKAESYSSQQSKQKNTEYGYILTDERGTLHNYDEVAQNKLKLETQLLYEEVKEEDMNFYIDMLFPELSKREKLEEIKHASTPIIINQVAVDRFIEKKNTKRVNNFDIGQKEQSRNNAKRLIVNSFLSNIGSNKKIYKVIVTDESIFYNKIKFSVFQITFDDFVNKITALGGSNDIENENEKNNNNKASFTNENSCATGGSVCSSVSSGITNKLSKLKSSLSSLRINVLDLKAPMFLKFLTAFFYIFILLTLVNNAIEVSLVFIDLTTVSNLLVLTRYFHIQKTNIENIMLNLRIWMNYKMNIIKDEINFNGTLNSVYIENVIYSELATIRTVEDQIRSYQPKFNQTIQNITLENNIEFNNYNYDSTISKDKANLQYFITRYLNTIDQFIKKNNNININNVFVEYNTNKYDYSNKPFADQGFIRDFLFIFNNDAQIYNFYVTNVNSIHTIIQLQLERIQKIKLFYVFIIDCILSIILFLVYTLYYFNYANLRFGILELLMQISYENIEDCYQNAIYMETFLDKIIQDDEFFIMINKDNIDDLKVDIPPRNDSNSLNAQIPNTHTPNINTQSLHISTDSRHSRYKGQSLKTNEHQELEMSNLKHEVDKDKNNNSMISFSTKNQLNDNSNSLLSDVRLIDNKHDDPAKINLSIIKETEENETKRNQQNNLTIQNKDLKNKNNGKTDKDNKDNKDKKEDNTSIAVVKYEQANQVQQIDRINRLKKKYCWNVTILFINFFNTLVFLVTFFIIDANYDYVNKTTNLMTIIEEMRLEYKSYIADPVQYLYNNSFSPKTKDSSSQNLFQKYNATRFNMFKIDNFFMNYGSRYKTFIQTYDIINNEKSFCYYFSNIISLNYSTPEKALSLCKSSQFNKGFELGKINTLDFVFMLLNNIINDKTASSIKTRIKYMTDPVYFKIQNEIINIYEPISEYLYVSYIDITVTIFNEIGTQYIIKIIFLVVIFLINFYYYYFKVYVKQLRKLVYNKAIILLIPVKAFKGKEVEFHDYLRVVR